MLRRQCEIQSQKYNVGELPNVKMFADVSSEGPSSERLLRVCERSLETSQQTFSHLAVHQHYIFDYVKHISLLRRCLYRNKTKTADTWS